jgi:hypothetical protein
MRWVKRLLSISSKDAWVESQRLSENPLFSKTDVLPLYAMAELLAQAYAAMKGYQDLSAGLPVRKGFLVGIRKLELFRSVSGTRSFLLRVCPTGAFGGFFMADGEVTLDGARIAAGSVKVWVPDK